MEIGLIKKKKTKLIWFRNVMGILARLRVQKKKKKHECTSSLGSYSGQQEQEVTNGSYHKALWRQILKHALLKTYKTY